MYSIVYAILHTTNYIVISRTVLTDYCCPWPIANVNEKVKLNCNTFVIV